MSFISTLRIFLIDVISITKANCATPMNYYNSMMVVLVGTKLVLVLLLLGPWLWGRLRRSGRFKIMARQTERSVRERVSELEDNMAGRRRASVAREIQRSLRNVQQDAVAVDWMKVFRTSFMVLFVSYPGGELLSSSVTITVTVCLALACILFLTVMLLNIVSTTQDACRLWYSDRRVAEDHEDVPMRGSGGHLVAGSGYAASMLHGGVDRVTGCELAQLSPI